MTADDGQCGAWARFFQAITKVQGIATTIKEVKPCLSYGFLVKNWTFSSPGTGTYPYIVSLAAGPYNGAAQLSGVAGQSNSDPRSWFTNHAVVSYGSTIYDPSYGGASYSSTIFLANFETNSLAGYCNANYAQANNHKTIDSVVFGISIP